MNDLELKHEIEQMMLEDDRLSLHPISIEVDDGHVRLGGSVQTWRRKLIAHEIAASFEEAEDVENDIDVSPALLPDDDVADNVRASLDASADLNRDTLTVSCRSGIVTLAGHTQTPWERVVAQDVALACRGVRDVDNQILVDARVGEQDEAVASDIRTAMRESLTMRHTAVDVAVNGPAVVLSGRVRHVWQREAATRIARRFRPWMIRNRIRLESNDPE